MTSKPSSIWNPWLLITIVLTLVFAAFIFYDKSPTFHKNINYVLGIEEEVIVEDTEQLPTVNITVLTDKYFENPPYDLEQEVNSLQDEIEANVNLSIIDINDDEGKILIENFDMTTLPVLVFDEKVTETNFYKDAASFFTKQNDQYLLVLQPFKYLKYPEVSDGQIKGIQNDSAPITIIEYSSFTCSYCALMKDVIYQALSEYPDKIRYVYKHYNRGGIDPLLANAAECTGEQGKFWEMHDYIFDNIKDIEPEELETALTQEVENLGLDNENFQNCMKENRYGDKIEKQTKEAFSFAINGTPAFFVNDVFIGGAVPYESLKSTIESF